LTGRDSEFTSLSEGEPTGPEEYINWRRSNLELNLLNLYLSDVSVDGFDQATALCKKRIAVEMDETVCDKYNVTLTVLVNETVVDIDVTPSLTVRLNINQIVSELKQSVDVNETVTVETDLENVNETVTVETDLEKEVKPSAVVEKEADLPSSDLVKILTALLIMCAMFCCCCAFYGYYRFRNTTSLRERETRLKESEERCKVNIRQHEEIMKTQNMNEFALPQGPQTQQPTTYHQISQQQRQLPDPLHNEYNPAQVYRAQDLHLTHKENNNPTINSHQQNAQQVNQQQTRVTEA